MRLAKAFLDVQPVAHLGYSKMLLLLNVPSDKREEFMKKIHTFTKQQKDVYSMSKRELETAIRYEFKQKPKAESKDFNGMKNYKQLVRHINSLIEQLGNTNDEISKQSNELKELYKRMQKIFDEVDINSNETLQDVSPLEGDASCPMISTPSIENQVGSESG